MCLKPNSHISVRGRGAPLDAVRTFTRYSKANVRPKAMEVPSGRLRKFGFKQSNSPRAPNAHMAAVSKCSQAHTVAIKALLSFRRATFLVENNEAPVRSFTAVSLDLYIADNSFY